MACASLGASDSGETAGEHATIRASTVAGAFVLPPGFPASISEAMRASIAAAASNARLNLPHSRFSGGAQARPGYHGRNLQSWLTIKKPKVQALAVVS